MSMPLKPIIIMAGGTGGHIFPALAVAQHLHINGVPLLWLGTSTGMETKIVPANGIELLTIRISGLRRKGLLKYVIAPVTIFFALLQSIIIFIRKKPAAVLGMGGFASGPGGIAAWLMRIPLCIHEQNAIAGLTNKLLAPLATKVMTAFPHTFTDSKKCTVTGNPVREDILKIHAAIKQNRNVNSASLRILVLGGSQGAHKLNELVPETIGILSSKIKIEVYHQSGEKHLSITRNKYKKLKIDARVEAFISDMASAYSWAEIVICRSGAMTIAEISAAGLASILVPYPYAVDDHQTANAEYLVKSGAAFICQEKDLTTDKLVSILLLVAESTEQLELMSKNSYALAKPDATKQVANFCMEVAYA